MKNTKYTLLLLIALFTINFSYAQNNKVKITNNTKWNITPFGRKAFIENKGQFNNTLSVDKSNFKYCIDQGYFQVLFYNNEVDYRLTKITHKGKSEATDKEESDEEKELNTTTQTINIKWLNSNPKATIIVANKQDAYYSYGIIDKKGKPYTAMCNGFSKLIYKNLYSGIDVVYTFHPTTGIKYNLIIHPGADISQVKMQYNGNTKSFLSNKDLHLTTIIGNIIEHAPVTSYADNEEKIASSFTINNNIVSFNVAPYLKNKEIIIDPWVVVPAVAKPAYDNGVDNTGNIYIYGGPQGNSVVEKYSATGTLIWSLTPGINRGYYGDMLVDNVGNFYLSEGFLASGAHTYKFSPSSAMLWQSTSSPSFREHWRLALNCVTQKIIVAGGGTTVPTLNIAEISVATGILVNAKSVYSGTQSDVAGLAVDDIGKAYLTHSNPNIITYTDNLNNALANVPDGYNYSEIGISTPSYYPTYYSNGHNMMALGGTTFLFTSDGLTIKKWDRNTHALLASAAIPGGLARMSSGILADKCNNLFVGSNNGVYRFDFNLVQKEYVATSSAVYDIAYSSSNTDIIACGTNFLTPLPFSRESCAAITQTLTINPCTTSINTVGLHPTLGIPPFTYLWDDGNTDSTRTNLAPGIHTVMVKDAACVPSYTFDTIIIPNKLLFAKFNNTTVCNGISTQFNDSSTVSAGTLSWSWNFGDGTSLDTNQHPLHTYTNPGGYNTTLIITSSSGCSDTITHVVVVNPNPILNISSIDLCLGATSLFNNTSTIVSGTINNWSWNFGDTGIIDTSSLQTPTYTYTNSGTYNVTLIATSDSACSSTTSIPIQIFDYPIASFTNDSVCENIPVTFTNLSSVPTGNITNWNWDIDNNGSTDYSTQNITHLYTAGTYTTQLIVTALGGCSDTAINVVEVYPMPNAIFSFSNVCFGDSMLFNNSSNVSSGIISNWDWNFGNSVSSNIKNPSVFYNNEGLYNAQLITTTNYGCKDTLIREVQVWPLPNVSFTPTSVCLNDTTKFFDYSTVSNLYTTNNITNWVWNFGDNISSSMPVPTHVYSASGTFNSQLILTTNNGCRDSVSMPITVNPLPVVNFSADSLTWCRRLCPNFTDLSTIATGNNLSYLWDFSNGATATSQNPTYCFDNTSPTDAQSFDISLMVTSDSACVASKNIIAMITVYPKPIASFSFNPQKGDIYNNEISFIDESVIAQVWNWDLGDTATSLLQNPIHSYADSGNYTVVEYIENSYGCKDTTKQIVRIDPDYALWIPNVFTPDGDGLNDFFFAQGYGIKELETLVFDRWGDIIFEGYQLDAKWDGTYKGKLVQTGTYVYKIKAKDVFDKWHNYVGRVAVLK